MVMVVVVVVLEMVHYDSGGEGKEMVMIMESHDTQQHQLCVKE